MCRIYLKLRKENFMHNSLQYSHRLIKSKVQPGDLVIDATAGNGHDTLFLAELVGEKGQVLSYDIQKAAIDNTRQRLEKENLLHRASLIQRGHETIKQDLTPDSTIKAAMFNLGYLPGGEHSIVTKPNTTLKALQTLENYLVPRGMITIVAYHGHTGGKEELTALQNYLMDLDQKRFSVLEYKFINQANNPPILYVIEKKR